MSKETQSNGKSSKGYKDKDKDKDKFKMILDEDDPMIKTIIDKYECKKVFKKYSKITDSKIINTLIIKHKLIKYECGGKGCSVTNSWCNKPIKLHLVRINNQENDLRVENIKYYCLNCYSQSIDADELFKKVKNDEIIECSKCSTNLNNFGRHYQNMRLCKFCISKDNKKVITTDIGLWSSQQNNLSNDDISRFQNNDRAQSNNLDIESLSVLISNDNDDEVLNNSNKSGSLLNTKKGRRESNTKGEKHTHKDLTTTANFDINAIDFTNISFDFESPKNDIKSNTANKDVDLNMEDLEEDLEALNISAAYANW